MQRQQPAAHNRSDLRAKRLAAEFDAKFAQRLAAIRAPARPAGDPLPGVPAWYKNRPVKKPGAVYRSFLDYARAFDSVSPSTVSRDEQRVPGHRLKRTS